MPRLCCAGQRLVRRIIFWAAKTRSKIPISTIILISRRKAIYGKWEGNHPNRFLGVKFKIGGKTHYGWIRITVNSAIIRPFALMSATITEYGYETIANKSLGAGLASTNAADDQARAITEPPPRASLGMLALGAEGLALWRREEASVH